jgi:hypothetical protein
MEPVEVTAVFDPEGEITPLRFSYQGRTQPVSSTGRRWEDEQGLHILVMSPDNRVFELIFSPNGRIWYLRPVAPQDRAAA